MKPRYSCTDRLCGAEDCRTCHPELMPLDVERIAYLSPERAREVLALLAAMDDGGSDDE